MGPTDKPTAIVLDIETLNTIGGRLRDRSESIRLVTLADLVQDLLIAARACELLAKVRFPGIPSQSAGKFCSVYEAICAAVISGLI